LETVINYLDIPHKERAHVLTALFSIGFCPAGGKRKTLQREMEKSVRDKLPQYIFLFRDGKLIGYSFLIGEKEHISEVFPWWAVDNADELPAASAARLLEYAIRLCAKCGCLILADRLKTNLEARKNGMKGGK
jgi:hypothetical protein